MLEIGTMLSGRYEVLKRVGSGGMADVYMAKDHKLNRNVAVKVLKSEYVEDEKFLKKFETEAQAVARRLSHPNIVNVYDVGIEDGINYIVMELAEGMTLKEYIRRKGYFISEGDGRNFPCRSRQRSHMPIRIILFIEILNHRIF